MTLSSGLNLAGVCLDVGLKQLETVAGESVIFSWGTVTCVVSPVMLDDDYMMGGHNSKNGVSVALRMADAVGSLAKGDLFTYGGTTYQVMSVTRDLAGETIIGSEITV